MGVVIGYQLDSLTPLPAYAGRFCSAGDGRWLSSARFNGN
jgi:hypothetical protein